MQGVIYCDDAHPRLSINGRHKKKKLLPTTEKSPPELIETIRPKKGKKAPCPQYICKLRQSLKSGH